jgi:hypothetical protein
MSANDSFESAAEAFYKATGNVMPGKIGCLRDGDGNLNPEVARDFQIWSAAIDYMKVSASQGGR